MTESQFIEENKDKWIRLEKVLKESNPNPDELNALFRKVSGDLSYAQTYYPRRSVRIYINDLVNRVFDKLKADKPLSFTQTILNFYNETLPNEIIRNRSAFYTSLIVFVLSIAIGVYSTLVDNEFPKIILGPDYVDITQANINSGDPMAIYKSGKNIDSFLGITINNIRVAFIAYIFGILGIIGSIYILISNGVMVGVFQTMFYTKGLLITSMLVIWVHGTIEISSIIVAGASGIILGNSLVFPGTFTRMQSLRIGAMKSLTIMLSTVPFFLVAGFLEGFITRYTFMPDAIKITIIIISLFLILAIYVYKPIMYYRNGKYDENRLPFISFINDKNEFSQNDNSFSSAFNQYRFNIENIIFKYILPIVIFSACFFFYISQEFTYKVDLNDMDKFLYSFDNKGEFMVIYALIVLLYSFSFFNLIANKNKITIGNVLKNIFKKFTLLFIASVIFICPLFLASNTLLLLLACIFPFTIAFVLIEEANDNESAFEIIGKVINNYWYKKLYSSFLGLNITIVFLLFIVFKIADNVLVEILTIFIEWSISVKLQPVEAYCLSTFLITVFLLILFPLFNFLFCHRKRIIYNNNFSYDLHEKIENFGFTNRNQIKI